MQKGKNGMRRVAALVCSVALFATLLPVQVLATDEGIQEPLTAVTLLNENGEETVSEQGDADNQQEEAVACTKDADCAAETHEEDCPKYVAPDEEEDTDPAVSCTKGEDCAAETHEEDCPKYVAPDEDEGTEPAVSCTKSEDCQADTHEEGCSKNEAQDEEGTTEPAVSCTKDENCAAETHEEGCPKNGAVEQEQIVAGSNLEVAITDEDMAAVTDGTTAIAAALSRMQIEDVTAVTSLKVTTEGNAYLSPSDNEYIKSNFTALTSLDESECQCSVRNLSESYLTKSGLEDREYAEFGGLSEFSGLTALAIPKSAEVINSYSVNKTGLNDLVIPDSVLVIESGAFSGNTNLTGDIVIPDSVVFVGNNSFGTSVSTDCGTLTLGNSVKYIDNSAFTKRNFSGNLIIPDSVEYIGNWVFTTPAFTNGTWTLGSGLKYIGDASLSNICSGNSGTLFIPAQLDARDTAFGYNTFSKVVFEEGITVIRARVIRNSTSVTEVVLPAGVETIGTGAFSGCEQLSRVTVPDSVTAINTDAFNGTALSGVYLSASISSLGVRAFDDLPQNSIIYANNDSAYNLLIEENTNQWNRRYDSSKTALAVTNGGTFAADTQFTPGTLLTPTKNGAIFKGWYDNADFTDEAVNTAEAGKTYYAKWLDLGVADVSLEYRQTQTFTAPAGVTFSNWKSEDPSVVTVDNGTITAVGVGETTISVEAAANGQTTVAKISVTVTPMNITFGTGKGENPGGTITYQYNGGQAPAFSQFATFYPAEISDGRVSPVEGSSAVTLVEGKDIVFNYDAGAGSNDYEYLPLNVTSEANPETGLPVTVKLLNENYCFVTASNVTPGAELRLSVVVTNDLTESAITGLGDATLSFTYDGTGKAAVTGLTDISADNISQFTLHFHGWGGTAFAEQHLTGDASVFTEEAVAKIAPKEPGSYLMIFTGVSENHYAYQSWIMTINKATVTITAADKTVITGDSDGLPPLTSEDYTVTGLVGNDKLTTPPTLDYEYGANVDTVGTYDIIPSGAAANADRYTIQYVKGTLHVEKIAIIEGADQTWTQGSGSDLVIRSNADFSDFLRVEVNGNALVRDQDYTVRSGSTIVTIKAAYLDTLAAGDYTFAIVSKTGTASTHFTVKAKAAGESGASGNTGAATATPAPSGSNITYYTCPACGYHDWTATAEGYKCNHCGYVESAKQLSGYGNVKGVYEPKTSAAAARSVSSSAIPQTGDVMPVGLMGGVTVIAAAAFVALFVLRKRQNND